VDESNLQRQLLYGTTDVGRAKVDAARERIAENNPNVRIVTHHARLGASNALDILREYDVIVDGTDNFAARYLVNDACVLLDKPNVYGSVFRFEGQVSVFWASRGPCYRCLVREPPPAELAPSCAEGGVLGVLPGMIGVAQALEVLKLVLGVGAPLVGRLQLFDGLSFRWRELTVRKDPQCPMCGPSRSISTLNDRETQCAATADLLSISPAELRARLDAGVVPALVDVREPAEWDIVNLSHHGARSIPLSRLRDALPDLVDTPVVLYCLSGPRSASAAQELRAAGATNVSFLAGGIRAWIDGVEPWLPRY